jgi:hypothetical protein
VGAERAENVDRFEKVRLALAVVSEDQVQSRMEIDAGGLVVSEVGELQQTHFHILSAYLARRTGINR